MFSSDAEKKCYNNYTDYLSEVIKKVYIRITLSFNIKNVYIRNLDR